MVKKTLNDYTPEQLWKLERRLMMQDIKRNPESQQFFSAFVMHVVGVRKARTEALAYMKASEEHGREDFNKWVVANPLSPRAGLHLGMIERENAAPFVEHSKKFQSRKEGAIGETQKYINKLVADNPDLDWSHLKRMADKTIMDGMKDSTFQNKLSIARTTLGLNKK